MSLEAAHYVVTAHPPGGVLKTVKCNFLGPNTTDVLVAKSRKLEIRQPNATSNSNSSTASSPFPLVMQVPIHGRITSMVPLRLPQASTGYIFITTDQFRYAVISYNANCKPYPLETHASGSFKASGILGRAAECAPLVTVDPLMRCVALHLYDGLITVLPIHLGYTAPSTARSVLADPYHARIEERTLLDMVFLEASPEVQPQLALLHQDARGLQHVLSHTVDLQKKQVVLSTTSAVLKKSRVDGGSSKLIAVPRLSVAAAAAAAASATESTTTSNSSSSLGGVLILGQAQITYVQAPGSTRVVPLPHCLLLAWEHLPSLHGMPRYLLGDEFGNLHVLSLQLSDNKVTSLALDTLGSTVLCSSLTHLQDGLVFCASQFGDSQLVQIHDSPIQHQENELEATSYLSVVEEYTHLGPIVDFDLVPTSYSQQSQVICASGSSISGSLRLVKNGIGMKEYAAVEIPGILNMFSIRKQFADKQHAYLVQSFVGETRVLGVSSSDDDNGNDDGKMAVDDDEEEEDSGAGASLEEVVLGALDSETSSLYVGNVQSGDLILQITEQEVRLLSAATLQLVTTWVPESDDSMQDSTITVAAANEAGQIVLSLRGGTLIYLSVNDDGTSLQVVCRAKMDREVSCLNLNPFAGETTSSSTMDVDSDDGRPDTIMSNLVAVGLWDDFTVRLLSLEEQLNEVLQISLSTDEDENEVETTEDGSPVKRNRNNMMARSLCLVTMDATSSGSSTGVNMLFVGLGDGTLISFAVVQQGGQVTVRSKKEVSLGSQQINLVPLQAERGGTCVLATGDRPTVIYLAGGSKASSSFTPKLCYSNVNLSTTDEEEDDVSRPPSQQAIAVNVATPFFSPQLFDDSSLSNEHYSLCVSDDSVLRLGIIDDIQKLHVTTCRLGMAPRRVVHCPKARLFAVGCIESGIRQGGAAADEQSMGNCIRFLDDTNFDDIQRIDLEPHEMILSMVNAKLSSSSSSSRSTDEETKTSASDDASAPQTYLLVGTAYALPDEDEPTRGRILVLSCADEEDGTTSRSVKVVTELLVHGGVYSMSQFYNGMVLATVNSKTQLVRLSGDGCGAGIKLEFVGIGHHGHILSLFVKSRAAGELQDGSSEQSSDEKAAVVEESPLKKRAVSAKDKEQLAIVGDLMRSISLVQYYPEHQALEEIARDFNANWTTAVEMLTDDVYLGAENWNNLYVLRRNAMATSEEVRCRLDTVGEFHLGEMCNKFMCGSLVMPHGNNSASTVGGTQGGSSSRRKTALSPIKTSNSDGKPMARTRRPTVSIGSQTLFGTVDGTLGCVLGIDARTTAFFSTLERAMAKTIRPVGDFSHEEFRSFDADRRLHPAHGFVDGDLVESFLDLDRGTMEAVVKEMNRDGRWEIEYHGKSKVVDEHKGGDSADNEDDEEASEHATATLFVEDVLAMVEEMTMFH